MIARAAALFVVIVLLVGCAGKSDHEKSIKLGQVHYEMGIDALRKGNLPIAFRELIKARSFQPNDAGIDAALALAWRYRGDLKKSAALYQQSLQSKSVPATHNNYGNLLLQMGDLLAAEKQFRLALADPRYTRQDMVFINLGDVLSAQGKYDKAIAAYRKAGMINPKQILSKLREAEAFIRSHREGYAEALLRTMLRQQPTNGAALKALLPLLKQHHNMPQATVFLNKYIAAVTMPKEKRWGQKQLAIVEAWYE